MLKYVIATIIAAAPLSAQAADMAVKAPPIAAASTWTGCYAGANVGAGRMHTSIYDPGAALDVGSDNPIGVIGGGQFGCDYQIGKWVVGAQGMIDAAGVNTTIPSTGDPLDPMGVRTDWFATATGRIGFLVQPNALVYAKGGAAWINNSYSENCTDCMGYANGSASATQPGWTVGGGLEYAFLPGWSIFAEYNHMDFGTTTTTLTYNGFPGTYAYNYRHDLDNVLLGVNFRFGR